MRSFKPNGGMYYEKEDKYLRCCLLCRNINIFSKYLWDIDDSNSKFSQ